MPFVGLNCYYGLTGLVEPNFALGGGGMKLPVQNPVQTTIINVMIHVENLALSLYSA